MKKLLKRATILLSMLLLVSCSPANKETGKVDENKTNKDLVRLAMYTEIDSLSPFRMIAGDTKTVMDQVFDGLYDVDENGNLVPDLAESYEVSEDGIKYIFNLKKGVKFHNGKDFKAEDVVFTYEEYSDNKNGNKSPKVGEFAVLKEIKALDDYKIEITLNKRYNSFIYLTTRPITPKDYMDSETNPVGTGPFKFVSYMQGQKLVLEKNEDYHRKDHIPAFKTLEVVRISDRQTVINAIKTGEIDIATKLTVQETKDFADQLNIVTGPQNLVQVLALNNQFGPLKDIRVRKAINYAINRDELIKTLAEGQASKIFSNYSPALKDSYNDLGNFYPYDLEKAKELLKEAGYDGGINLSCKVPSDYQFHMDTAQVVQTMLAEVGINLEIQPIEFATWLDDVYKGKKFETSLCAFVGYADPYQILKRYQSTNKSNFIGFNNEEYDKAMKEALSTSSLDKQVENYKLCQKILAEEASGAYLMDPNMQNILRKGYSGLKMYPTQKLNLEDIKID